MVNDNGKVKGLKSEGGEKGSNSTGDLLDMDNSAPVKTPIASTPTMGIKAAIVSELLQYFVFFALY